MPFLAEKVASMLTHIIAKGNEDALGEEGDDALKKALAGGNTKAEKKISLRNKIRSVGRMQKMFGTLREESEMILKIK